MITQPVGQFDLRQKVLVKVLFGVRRPVAPALQLVDDAAFRALSPGVLATRVGLPACGVGGVRA
jgi:hypothetical protein